MPGVEARGFDSPDETRTPSKTKVDVVRMGGATAARMTFEPGHDAWTVGDEKFVGYEFEQKAAEEYARS